MISWSQFEAVEMRCGTIVRAEPSQGLRSPAIWLWIDFGPLGVKKSSAQITGLYSPEEVVGKQVVAVVNFPPKQIGHFLSECLVLAAVDKNSGHVILLAPERETTNGTRIS
jgi:tRNA-binding protein